MRRGSFCLVSLPVRQIECLVRDLAPGFRQSQQSDARPMVPADGTSTNTLAGTRPRLSLARSSLPQHLLVVGAVGAVTVAAFVFTPIIGAHATALVFLLTVVLLAVVVQRGPALLAAALSALSWDYFFLPPAFAFAITDFEDAMFLGMYFVVALVLGQLTARIRSQEEAERRREERATTLYLFTRELSQSANLDQFAQSVVRQMGHLFNAQIAILIPDSTEELKVHSASSLRPNPAAQQKLTAALGNRQNATGPVSTEVDGIVVLPLGLPQDGPALIGLRPLGSLAADQKDLIEALSQPIVLAFDRHRLNEISERTKLLAESERLSKTLLDSVSHELRTPISVIRNAAENLVEPGQRPEASLQSQMIAEIREATDRLNRLVGNVLEASRLESGNVRPRINDCDVAELVHIAVAEAERELANHTLTVRLPERLPLVRMDFVLMQQVVTNLLSNAAVHTPPATAIELIVEIKEDALVLSVADSGPGVPPASLNRLFAKFYRAPNVPAGGTGLGLSLVKGFVEAHGGQVRAENRTGGGAVFTVSIPLASSKLPGLANDERTGPEEARFSD
jgi:two-component system, OmpR family, sensor histidine kinase KdpD